MGLISHFMNHKTLYVHWGFIQMSISNAIIIVLMFCLFLAALLLPFPHEAKRDSEELDQQSAQEAGVAQT
jgi:hypothetical protein